MSFFLATLIYMELPMTLKLAFFGAVCLIAIGYLIWDEITKGR